MRLGEAQLGTQRDPNVSQAAKACCIAEIWFRDVDSNHDTQLQRLMSYRLDDPGNAFSSLTEPSKSTQTSITQLK